MKSETLTLEEQSDIEIILQAVKAGQKELLTPAEFAARLGVTVAHVYNMKSSASIPSQCLVLIGTMDYRIDWPVWLEYQRRKNGGILYLKKGKVQ
jgi:hypothetical protein